MKTEIELPADVIAEIESNRKVNAIKLLRSQQGIGLKEAKQIVDSYMEKHPFGSRLGPSESEGGIGRIFVLVIGVFVIYGVYKYLS